MRKTLKFTSNLVPLILSNGKVSTWRFFDEKDLKVGDVVDFTEAGTNKYFATAVFTKIIQKPLGSLTAEDKIGHEEFASDAEMFLNYSKYYGKPVDATTEVKLIWFRLLAREDRLELLLAQFPLLLGTIKKLNEQKVTWAIGGSSCLYLFGNERVPGDVDIFIKADQHDLVDQAFGLESYKYFSDREEVRNSRFEHDHSVQLASNLHINDQDAHYVIDLDGTVMAHVLTLDYQGEKVNILPPEEALLIKSLLHRGSSYEKRDLEDIREFVKIYPNLDHDYLNKRRDELKVPAPVMVVFDPQPEPANPEALLADAGVTPVEPPPVPPAPAAPAPTQISSQPPVQPVPKIPPMEPTQIEPPAEIVMPEDPPATPQA